MPFAPIVAALEGSVAVAGDMMLDGGVVCCAFCLLDTAAM
jgi:hypothetical protein